MIIVKLIMPDCCGKGGGKCGDTVDLSRYNRIINSIIGL